MATDLVCGMIVNPDSAPAKSTYEGNEYSFCATYCKEVFESNPQKFIQDSRKWDKATDPVCGMRVSIPRAEAMSVYQGDFIYFCSEACKQNSTISRTATWMSSGKGGRNPWNLKKI